MKDIFISLFRHSPLLLLIALLGFFIGDWKSNATANTTYVSEGDIETVDFIIPETEILEFDTILNSREVYGSTASSLLSSGIRNKDGDPITETYISSGVSVSSKNSGNSTFFTISFSSNEKTLCVPILNAFLSSSISSLISSFPNYQIILSRAPTEPSLHTEKNTKIVFISIGVGLFVAIYLSLIIDIHNNYIFFESDFSDFQGRSFVIYQKKNDPLFHVKTVSDLAQIDAGVPLFERRDFSRLFSAVDSTKTILYRNRILIIPSTSTQELAPFLLAAISHFSNSGQNLSIINCTNKPFFDCLDGFSQTSKGPWACQKGKNLMLFHLVSSETDDKYFLSFSFSSFLIEEAEANNSVVLLIAPPPNDSDRFKTLANLSGLSILLTKQGETRFDDFYKITCHLSSKNNERQNIMVYQKQYFGIDCLYVFQLLQKRWTK